MTTITIDITTAKMLVGGVDPLPNLGGNPMPPAIQPLSEFALYTPTGVVGVDAGDTVQFRWVQQPVTITSIGLVGPEGPPGDSVVVTPDLDPVLAYTNALTG